jgi:Ca-activated chloride channel family protein
MSSTNAIWREALRERQRGLGLQKLLKDVSLLLLLLLALLLAIGLSDPRWSTQTTQRSDVVIVLDVSASMKSRTAATFASKSRFAEVKAQAKHIIDSLPENGRALIMTSGRSAELQSGFETDRDYLQQILDGLQPTDVAGRPRAALELALSLLRNVNQGRVYFLSDGAFDDNIDFKTPQIEYRFVGAPSRNVAITRFDFRAEIGTEDRFQILLNVRNYTSDTLSVPTQVTLGERVLIDQSIQLAPHESKTLVVPFEGLARGQARAVIGLDDDLEADNHAFAVMKSDERLHILLVSQGNFYLESVFEALPNVLVTRVETLPESEYSRQVKRHDVVVFDGVTPAQLTPGRFLLINAVAPGLPFSAMGSVERPNIDGKSDSALVRQLDFGGVRIDKAISLTVDEDVDGLTHLFWSKETDLALALAQQDQRVVYIGFKLSDSSFPLSTAFPLFLNESLGWLRPRQNRHQDTQTQAGESFVISVPAHQSDLIVRTPDGDGLIYAVEKGRVVFDETGKAGIYRYEHAGAARYFAVNLTDEGESDIEPRATIPPSLTVSRAAEESQVTIALWPYLLALALVTLTLEWGVWCWRVGSA